jgi:hypothetical protein
MERQKTLNRGDKARISEGIEVQSRDRGNKGLLDENMAGVVEKPRTPFNALDLKRRILGYSNGPRELDLTNLAMEMSKSEYPATGNNLREVAADYIGQGRRFIYEGFLGIRGILDITKIGEGRYRISSSKPPKK